MLVPEHTDLKVPESRLLSCHCSKCSSFFSSGTKAEQLTQGSANVSPDTSDHGVPSVSLGWHRTVIPPEMRWQVGTKKITFKYYSPSCAQDR